MILLAGKRMKMVIMVADWFYWILLETLKAWNTTSLFRRLFKLCDVLESSVSKHKIDDVMACRKQWFLITVITWRVSQNTVTRVLGLWPTSNLAIFFRILMSPFWKIVKNRLKFVIEEIFKDRNQRTFRTSKKVRSNGSLNQVLALGPEEEGNCCCNRKSVGRPVLPTRRPTQNQLRAAFCLPTGDRSAVANSCSQLRDVSSLCLSVGSSGPKHISQTMLPT
ncbi:hypothetical protein J6590_066263 [Homalodisca vitripennis]|nr:hypothetical protein J6590_066263 [Homalodisca vitripennis]